jgi:hypothetical protein
MFRARPSTKELLPLLVAVVVLYWQPALGFGSFFQRDVFLYWIPRIEWAVRSLAEGRLPQWDASFGFGVPFLADPNFQPFYPVTWLNLVFQPSTVFTVLVVGHTLLGAWGMFHLLRRRVRSREAAFVGGIVFVGGGALVSSATLWHHYSSAMYMPWVADAFLRVRAGRRGAWIRLGVMTGLQALAGSADAMLMTAFGLLFLLPLKPKRLALMAPSLGAGGLLCFALAAAQWLPTMRGVADTERSGLSAQTRLYWSVPPATLIDLVLPLTGAAHAGEDQPNPLEQRFRLITSMYLGASTLPLLILGAMRWPRGLLLLVLSLGLAMGRHGPLAWVSELPVVSMVRFPSKILWLSSMVWAALAAIGLAVWVRRRSALSRSTVAMVGLVLLALAAGLAFTSAATAGESVAGEAIRKAVPWALMSLGLALLASALPGGAAIMVAVVVAMDLMAVGPSVNAYSSGEMLRLRPSVVDVLRGLEASRIFVLPASRQQARSWKAPANWSDEEAYFFSQGQMLVPPQGGRWGLKGSFDGDFAGLAPRAYTRLSDLVAGSNPVNPRWLQMGGVTHVLRFAAVDEPGMEVAARVDTLHEQDLLVLRVPEPRPHAYFASRVRVVDSEDEAVRVLGAADFDLAEEIVRVREAGLSGSATPDGAPGAALLRVEQQIDGRTAIRVKLEAPRTLVVLDAISGGWSARVDGQPAAVRPANLIFQSVDLPPGEHLVELEYQTPGLILGVAISLLAWLSLLVRAGLRNRRRDDGRD